MSILSEARALELDFKAGAAKIEAWGAALYAKLPAPVHAMVDAEISIAKQGLSNAIDMANSAAGPIIDAEAETTFRKLEVIVSALASWSAVPPAAPSPASWEPKPSPSSSTRSIAPAMP